MPEQLYLDCISLLKGNTHKIRQRTKDLKSEGVKMVEKELLVRKMENGVVVDHIPPGKALSVLKILCPDPSSTVIVAQNIDSSTHGKKDLITIEGKYLTSKDVDYLSLVAPKATITLIENGKIKKEQTIHYPNTLETLFTCPNPSCVTNAEHEPKQTMFNVLNEADVKTLRLQCASCGTFLSSEKIENDLASTSVGRGLVSKEKILKTFLNLLLTKNALKIAPTSTELFTLKSGRASPYFINVGSLTDGASLAEMKWLLASYIAFLLDEGELEDFDFIFGPAYKGITLAALACEGLNDLYGINKRYLYDRKEEKTYGDVSADRIIVGANHFKAGQKVLLIDDVATTGGTKVDALEKLKRLGSHIVVGLVLVVNRQEKMGDTENVEQRSAVQFIQDEFNVKAFSILDAKTIYNSVKDDLPRDVGQYWIDYFTRYGSVNLR